MPPSPSSPGVRGGPRTPAPAALPRVVLRAGGEARARSGHPWVFRKEIAAVDSVPGPGALVDFVDGRGRLLGRGTFNPALFICGRILTRVEEAVDEAFFARRIDAALAARRRIYPKESCYRLVASEGDLLPGLVVDRYEDALCVQALTAGMDALLPRVLAALERTISPETIVLRHDPKTRQEEGLPREVKVVKGRVDGPRQVGVSGQTCTADLLAGYKTGLYLDQRDNWRMVRPFAEGARVLDAFCYAGGFSIAAARLGAREILGIDIAEEAVAQARRDASLNGVAAVCRFETANAFDRLKDLSRRKERFDLVILDPPSFARRKNKVPEALRGYKEIHLQALRLLAPGGHLLTFTCSYHVGRDLFLGVIRQAAADLGRSVVVEQHLGQARDHPVRLECPETEYLKGLILRVE